MKKIKIIISYLITILLSISLSTLILIIVLNSNILNKTYITNTINDSNYYETLKKSIDDSLSELTPQSGFNDEILDNIYTINDLKKETKLIINSIYNNKKYNPNKEYIKRRLEDNINKFIENNNINITNKAKKQIEKFENTIIEAYYNQISYSNSIINNIRTKVNKLNNIIQPVTYVLISLIIVLLSILFIINHIAIIEYIYMTLIISSTLLLIPKVFEYNELNLSKKTVLNNHINIIVREVLNNIYDKLQIYSIIFLIIGILLLITNIIILSKKQKKIKQ